MQPLFKSDFSLRLAQPQSDFAAPRSEIILAGKGTGSSVDGVTLEAAIRWNDFYVAFLTDDCPFEETLHIYLLDQRMGIIDSAHMYWLYCTGTFSDLELAEPNFVHFKFFGDITWRLELFSRPTFMLPFFSAPTGVHRAFRFHHHFRVHGKPLSEADN